MIWRTRFAPSPTGLLHLGHAYSACLAHDMAIAAGGEFLLRIEDTDTARCRPEYEDAIFRDLDWLGLSWPQPVWRQSERLGHYQSALEQLADAGLCYPCGCSRGDIRAALSAPQEGHDGQTPDGPLYPGTCRGRDMASQTPTDAIRLNMRKALQALPNLNELTFDETGAADKGIHHLAPDHLLSQVGDIVLARRDSGVAAYHLSVVVDDAAQGISDVIRGVDLFTATFIHRLLQALLGLPTPRYHHHRLIRDEAGQRLAKRDDARAIGKFRDDGRSPQDVRRMVGLQPT